MPALFLGTIYLGLAFVLGLEIGSVFVALLVLGIIAFGVISTLATVIPIDKL